MWSRNVWSVLKHEKQSLFSATSFVLSVGVLFLKDWHLHSGCFSLHATQLEGDWPVLLLVLLLRWLDDDVDAKLWRQSWLQLPCYCLLVFRCYFSTSCTRALRLCPRPDYWNQWASACLKFSSLCLVTTLLSCLTQSFAQLVTAMIHYTYLKCNSEIGTHRLVNRSLLNDWWCSRCCVSSLRENILTYPAVIRTSVLESSGHLDTSLRMSELFIRGLRLARNNILQRSKLDIIREWGRVYGTFKLAEPFKLWIGSPLKLSNFPLWQLVFLKLS